MRKVLLWIVKKCIIALDSDGSWLAYSFSKDEVTEYHIIVERFLPDRHCFGTRVEPYPNHAEYDTMARDGA